ncbi:protein-tyrosine-phosphatase MKP1 [Prunus yedoensis var. nudiflora]|uniref:Protein-tyrosine-phosphatase MKP1 n=1 Tax=Prunus yedoensis var. nudiflora TaxID=2094558 RepID=A0A314UT89_PRUYE|nr:protein-tyrosine-phosphatase MKP1 [Prunus yedoensis var. nudiflora]
MSNSPENVVSNCSSQSYSRSTSLPSKKLSSLAERRGSLSLKLPVMSDKMRLMSTSSKFLSTKEDGVRINDSTCSVGHIDDIDKVLEPKDGVQNGGEDSRQQCNICQKEPSFIKHSAEPWKDCSLKEGAGSSASKETGESCPAQRNFMQPFVCRWPSLEKIATFGVRELDSKSAFTIYSPNTGVGKSEDSVLYLWVGRFFHCGNFPIQLDSGRERTDVEETDWDQVSCDVLIQMGFCYYLLYDC